jgi:hypothetical protein
MDEVRMLLDLQDGVITRQQALAAGLSEVMIARLVRRREWVPVHRAVYVNHTGPLTWRQRAWAAVLLVGRPRWTAGRRSAPTRGPDAHVRVWMDRSR